MAVYRQIQTSFWQDPFVLDLTPEEKYFYLYLMTNTKTKACGIYELPKKIIELETGYNRETVTKLLNKFIEYGKIFYSEDTNEIMLKNWLKYNNIKSNTTQTCIRKELESIKNKEFVAEVNKILIPQQCPLDTPSIPPADTRGEKEKEKEKDIEKDLEEEKEIDKKIYGNYENVFLSEQEYKKLEGIILNTAKLNELINELSENIERGKAKNQVHLDNLKAGQGHCAEIMAYWKFRKQNPDKFNKTKDNNPTPAYYKSMPLNKEDLYGDRK